MTSANRPQAGKPRSPQLQHRPNHRQRILVVDDDEDIRRLDLEALVGSGYTVDAAADGADAWNVIQLNRYDLLVTDYNMPRMTGIELLLKIHAARMALPVIMVCGTMPLEKLKRHPWLQIDATLLKPYTTDQLLATVKNVLYATSGLNPGRV